MMKYFIIFVFVLNITPTLAGSCLKDSNEITLIDNAYGERKEKSIRFRNYFCRTQSGNIQVQFHRLNDYAMGEILYGHFKHPLLKKIFSQGRVLKNSTYKEYEKIVTLYGHKIVGGRGGNVSTPGNLPVNIRYEFPTDTSKYWDIKVLVVDPADNPWIDFPQPDPLLYLHKYSKLPHGFSGSVKGTVWSYMKKNDLKNYKNNIYKFNRIVAKALKEYKFDFYKEVNKSANIKMLEYLTRKNFPKYFSVVTGQSNKMVYGCGGKSWKFSYYSRLPIVDVMVIENTSQSRIKISSLMGVKNRTNRLRPQNVSKSLYSKPAINLITNLGYLNPGEKFIIPTRIMFATPPGLKQAVKKLRKKPKFVNYVYGPEIAIKGFSVNSEKIVLEGNSANFLQLTSSCECGSCPYLYSWNKQNKEWDNHGKVIHKAKGKENKQTETRVLDGLVTQYQLREQEAELAYIDHVFLKLILKDGRSITLKPSHPKIAKNDNTYSHIFFGQTIEMNFIPPAGLKAEDVKTSTLSVTGYYERYSDILAQQSLKKKFNILPVNFSRKP